MNQMVAAIEEMSNQAETANGAATLKSSGRVFTDLFAIIGSCRNNTADAVRLFAIAYAQDRAIALRILFWARDCRGGAGERKVFQEILKWLYVNDPEMVFMIVIHPVVEEFGRFDDYVDIMVNGPKHAAVAAASHINTQLILGNGLAAKWMPRKGVEAAKIRKLMGYSPKQYRKTLVSATRVVESQMCSKQWNEIKFEHVPSVAMTRYTKAFAKNAPDQFGAYKAKLKSGEVAAKSTVLFPYDVVRTVKSGGDPVVADAQWKALPNFLESGKRLMPIIDVSSSMGCPVSGESGSSLLCMDVAVSLGMYIAQKQSGPFKNLALTFDDTPRWITIPDADFKTQYDVVVRSPWGGSTNLQASFNLILQAAIEHNVPQEDMPEYLFIVSDMEFNEVEGRGGYYPHKATTNFQEIDRKYAEAGYTRPNIIFWQVNARAGNIQTKFDENNTAMISGFSPAILKSVLNCEAVTPEMVMLQAIMVERYQVAEAIA